jgi:hypothetical protein
MMFKFPAALLDFCSQTTRMAIDSLDSHSGAGKV